MEDTEGTDITVAAEEAEPPVKIRPRYKMFADEWLTGAATGKPFNIKAAYVHAGYKPNARNPYSDAFKLLRHPEVQAYLKQRMQDIAMSAEEVVARFSMIARNEAGNIVKQGPNKTLQLDTDAVMEMRPAIKSFGYDANGQPKIEFHDSMDALKQLAKIKGVLKDSMELSGPGGGGVPVTMTVQFVNPDGSQAHPTGNNTPQPKALTAGDEDWDSFEREIEQE